MQQQRGTRCISPITVHNFLRMYVRQHWATYGRASARIRAVVRSLVVFTSRRTWWDRESLSAHSISGVEGVWHPRNFHLSFYSLPAQPYITTAR